MIPVSRTFEGHISSRLPQNNADLKTESSTVFLSSCLCRHHWHWNSDACTSTPIKSVVSRTECAMCWSPRAYCSPMTSTSKELHLISALAFLQPKEKFSVEKFDFSLLLLFFQQNTIYFTFLFYSDIYKMSTKRGTPKELMSFISLVHLSFEIPQH